jgi:large subunit ribosomal protein L29
MVEAADIAEYDIEELERQLSESRRELFNLRFQLATGQLDNFSRITHVRKDVARMMTELRIREIAEAEGMAMDELPAHQAAARRRSEDEALGRSHTTAAERRAARAAEEAGEDDVDGTTVEGELADEVADDDGMPRPEGYTEDSDDEVEADGDDQVEATGDDEVEAGGGDDPDDDQDQPEETN